MREVELRCYVFVVLVVAIAGEDLRLHQMLEEPSLVDPHLARL